MKSNSYVMNKRTIKEVEVLCCPTQILDFEQLRLTGKRVSGKLWCEIIRKNIP
jgi:hypothetical protein